MAFNFNVISNSYSDYDTPEEVDRLGAGDGNGRGWGEADSIGTKRGKGDSYSGCCGDGDGDGDGDDNSYGNSVGTGRGRSDVGGMGDRDGCGLSYSYGGDDQNTLATAIKAVSKGTTLTPQQYNQLVAKQQAYHESLPVKLWGGDGDILLVIILTIIISIGYIITLFKLF